MTLPKYVILYSRNEPVSKAFADANSEETSIDFGNPEDPNLPDYKWMGFPDPSIFPCVVDTEAREIMHGVENLADAKQSIEDRVSELKWAAMRKERDARMDRMDKRLMSDSSATQACKDATTAYRTLLKNLPDTIEDIDDFEWPEEPAYEKVT